MEKRGSERRPLINTRDDDNIFVDEQPAEEEIDTQDEVWKKKKKKTFC